MTEIRTIEEYLDLVRHELAGSDPSLVQDVLFDIDELLRSEQAEAIGELDEEALVAKDRRKTRPTCFRFMAPRPAFPKFAHISRALLPAGVVSPPRHISQYACVSAPSQPTE